MRLTAEKKWLFESVEHGEKVDGVPPLILSLLAQRGIATEEEMDRFFNPSLHHLPDPSTMAGLAEAAAILEKAVVDGNKVVVYGDYDADGVTATALLVSFFEEIGLRCVPYIPDRLTEGYGLNPAALHKLRGDLDKSEYPEPVLVTVDCGISAHAEIKEARSLGFKVIVTDHHQPPEQLPNGDAVINPHRKDCPFPDKNLSGVGVAFYLIIGLRGRLTESGYWAAEGQPNLKKYLDLVAVGTIADLVPLTGVNRVLVRAGLEVMNQNPRPGLAAIMKNLGNTTCTINAGSVAYQIAPRINAAGRVASANLALEVLLSSSIEEAAGIAELLEAENSRRKQLSEEAFKDACLKAEVQVREGWSSLVLFDENWHIGLIGLIASRISDRFYRPTVVLTVDDQGMIRGSARSVEELDLYATISECSEHLEKFGGHKSAAGLTVKPGMFDEFREKFKAVVNRLIGEKKLQPSIYVNLRASFMELNKARFLEYLEKMEPFGSGNPEPVFCNREGEDVYFEDLRKIGMDSIRFKVRCNGAFISGVGFGMAEMLPMIENVPVNLAYRLVKNEFRGVCNWEIRAEDIKPA